MAACRSRGADRPCYPPRRMRWAPILGAVLVAGCVDLGDGPHPGVSGRVTATNGFVFLERGQVQLGTFERAGLIGPDGRFQVWVGSHGGVEEALKYINLLIFTTKKFIKTVR